MGCDIHSAVEVFDSEKWNWIKEIQFPSYGNRTTNEPFDWRHYNMFCFLADVYCRSGEMEHLSSYRGLPKDLSLELQQDYGFNKDLWLGEFGHGYLLLSEILNFDYNKNCPNKVMGKDVTYREMLGISFFNNIDIMKILVEDPTKIRIVFGFDN